MNHYIVYFVDGTHQYITTSINLEDTDNLPKLNIKYENFDYLVKVDKKIDPITLNFKKHLPDGNVIWKKEKLIQEKIKNAMIKRESLFKKLDIDFLVSLEVHNNKTTEIIKRNKNFLRDLSCRKELHSIHDCEKIAKFNPFYNLVDIEIIDAGYGCSEKIPVVDISNPIETDKNFGFKATAKAVVGANGQLIKITVERLGSGYIQAPEIKISGYESESAKHPILKPIIDNII